MTFRDYNSFQITREFLTYVFGHITVQNTGYKTDCWLWTQKNGQLAKKHLYGYIWRNNVAYIGHRVMYATFVHHITDATDVIDHLCRVQSCINPAHLEQVTFQENVLRGISIPAQNAKKTHCVNGHELTVENTYLEPSGNGRKCRICRNAFSVAKRRRDGRQERSTTHCPQGHIFNAENTYTHKISKAKNCRVCRRLRNANKRLKQTPLQ